MSSHPLHLLSHSLSQFISDELVSLVDESEEGTEKDVAILVIHTLDKIALQTMDTGKKLVAAAEATKRKDPGINTLHILSHSLTQCLEDSLQRIVADAPDGADKDAADFAISSLVKFIDNLNIAANTLSP